MQIKKIEVKNFRLLKDVELFLETRTTVIVGRNNSGKTSLAELFRRLLLENSANFRLDMGKPASETTSAPRGHNRQPGLTSHRRLLHYCRANTPWTWLEFLVNL